jgi:hypothetical protein
VYAVPGTCPITRDFAARQWASADESGFRECIQVNGRLIFISYDVFEGQLESVFLTFSSDAFDDLVAGYTDKFGTPPHCTRNEKIATHTGDEYMNVIVTWKTDGGIFYLKKYGSTVDRGYGSIQSDTLRKRRQEAEERGRQTLKGKL